MTAQELYTLLFAVTYGGMLASLNGLNPFPWGKLGRGDGGRRALWRLCVSHGLFTLLPLVLFSLGFIGLASVELRTRCLHLNCKYLFASLWQLLRVGLCAVWVLAPYQLFHAIAIGGRYGRWRLYPLVQFVRIAGKRGFPRHAKGPGLAALVYFLVPIVSLGSLMWGSARCLSLAALVTAPALVLAALGLLSWAIKRWAIMRPESHGKERTDAPDVAVERVPVTGAWSLSDERSHMETLLNQRLNFLLVFFGLILAGAMQAPSRSYFTGILLLGLVITVPLSLGVVRAHVKFDVALRRLLCQPGHPARWVDAQVSRRWGMRGLVGVGVPLVLVLVLWAATVAACLGYLSPPAAPTHPHLCP